MNSLLSFEFILKNYPLYLRSTSSRSEGSIDEDLKFFYTVHTSLDVIEERMFASSSNPSKNSSGDPRELYLGLLYPTEDYRVWVARVDRLVERQEVARLSSDRREGVRIEVFIETWRDVIGFRGRLVKVSLLG